MRVFKTKPFRRFAERENISDEDICEAAARANAGRIDADLGGGVIKQRIAGGAKVSPAASGRLCSSAARRWRCSLTASPRAIEATSGETN